MKMFTGGLGGPLDRRPIPERARVACVELASELTRRFVPKWWDKMSRVRANAVRECIIAPIYKALAADSMGQLHRAASDSLRYYDDAGTDYSFLHDLKARLRVIELEALYGFDHDGAPFPP